MKLKFAILTAIVFSLQCIGLGQSPPGYMGKKNTLGLGFGILPVINGPDVKNRGSYSFDNENDGIGFDWLFNAEFTRTVNRYGSVSLLINKSATGVNSSFTAPLRNEDGSLTSQEFFHDNLLKADILSVGVLYNFFKRSKGGLSPLGNTFSIGLKRNMITTSILQTEEGSPIESIDRIGIDPKFGVTSIMLGWTNTQIFKDHFYFKTKFMFAGNFRLVDSLTSTFSFEPQSSFEFDVIERLIGHELFTVDISVGMVF